MDNNSYSLAILKTDFIKLNLFLLLKKLLAENNLLVISKAGVSMDLNFVKLLYQRERLSLSIELSFRRTNP